MTRRTRALLYILGLMMLLLGASQAVARASAADHSGIVVVLFAALGAFGCVLIHFAFIADRDI
jgi:hypothetical protein